MSPENDIRRATRSAAITRQRVTASRKPTSATVAETRHKRAQIDPMLIRWSPGRQSAERSPRQTTCPSASSPHLGGRRHRNTLADAHQPRGHRLPRSPHWASARIVEDSRHRVDHRRIHVRPHALRPPGCPRRVNSQVMETGSIEFRKHHGSCGMLGARQPSTHASRMVAPPPCYTNRRSRPAGTPS